MAKRDYMVLRGNRDYLHGASMFAYFLEAAGKAPVENLDLVISRQTRQLVNLTDLKARDEGPVVATFRSKGFSGKLAETTDPITERVPYDEPTAGITLDLNRKEVRVGVDAPGYVFIDYLVSAYKLLLTECHRGQGKKWIFARLRLTRIPQTAFTVTWGRIVSGHFYEGTIKDNGETLGQIYFSG
jgi:hypothetical protein